MASDNQPAATKTAWIDETNQIISFRRLENAQLYCAEESAFWDQILLLMRQRYKVQ